jgi:hypothetical protein
MLTGENPVEMKCYMIQVAFRLFSGLLELGCKQYIPISRTDPRLMMVDRPRLLLNLEILAYAHQQQTVGRLTFAVIQTYLSDTRL